jgi:hypothetical protein
LVIEESEGADDPKVFCNGYECPPAVSSKHGDKDSEEDSSRTKEAMCSDCKDGLYQFYCEGLNKGHTAGAIGGRLWSILRERERKKHLAESDGTSSSDTSSSGASSSGCLEPKPQRISRCIILDSSDDEEDEDEDEDGLNEYPAAPLVEATNKCAPLQCNEEPSKRRKVNKVSWPKAGPVQP